MCITVLENNYISSILREALWYGKKKQNKQKTLKYCFGEQAALINAKRGLKSLNPEVWFLVLTDCMILNKS